MHVETLLALDTSAHQNTVRKSMLPHLDLRLGSFLFQIYSESEVVGHVYGSLDYVNLI